MQISSTAFVEGQEIPNIYTCEGPNINPPLRFEDVPTGAQSFTLIVDDPDAPSGTWIHWLLFNIPPRITDIQENSVPAGAIEGLANGGTPGYEGPCPPDSTHTYRFQLYALDTQLNIPATSNTDTVREAMEGHILAEAKLTGTYHKAVRLNPL